MTSRFFDLAFTPSVQAEQVRRGSRAGYARAAGRHPSDGPDRLTHAETSFIAERDTFFLATVSETGWPYVQHRGGRTGFVRFRQAPDQAMTSLLWPEFTGNRQYVTAGNIVQNGRAALLFLDFVKRQRLKVLGHLTRYSVGERPDLMLHLEPDDADRAEALMLLGVEAFDWNCPQHIVQRYTEAETEDRVQALERRIRELEQAARPRAIAVSAAQPIASGDSAP